MMGYRADIREVNSKEKGGCRGKIYKKLGKDKNEIELLKSVPLFTQLSGICLTAFTCEEYHCRRRQRVKRDKYIL